MDNNKKRKWLKSLLLILIDVVLLNLSALAAFLARGITHITARRAPAGIVAQARARDKRYGNKNQGYFKKGFHVLQSIKKSRHFHAKNFWITAFLPVTVRASRKSTAAFCGGSAPAQIHPPARRSLSVTTP